MSHWKGLFGLRNQRWSLESINEVIFGKMRQNAHFETSNPLQKELHSYEMKTYKQINILENQRFTNVLISQSLNFTKFCKC